jgi:hypothetical protein
MPDKEIRVVQKEGAFTWGVWFGDRYDEVLGFDEALACVAAILLGVEPRYLRTEKEWEQYHQCFEQNAQKHVSDFDKEIKDG